MHKIPNLQRWEERKELLLNNTVKFQLGKNEFNIISKGFDKDIRITYFEDNKPVGHAEFYRDDELGIDQLIFENWLDGELTEIIEG